MHFSRKASSRLIFVGDDVDAFCMLLAGRSCLLSPLLSRLVDRLALCVCVCVCVQSCRRPRSLPNH